MLDTIIFFLNSSYQLKNISIHVVPNIGSFSHDILHHHIVWKADKDDVFELLFDEVMCIYNTMQAVVKYLFFHSAK